MVRGGIYCPPRSRSKPETDWEKVELKELIQHERGIWAVAHFLAEKLPAYAGHPLTAGSALDRNWQVPTLLAELDPLLRHAEISEWISYRVRQIVIQLLDYIQCSGFPGCDAAAFRRWAHEEAGTDQQVDYLVAAIDGVLADFAWSPGAEIQMLESLRKALPANWGILKQLREMTASGAMGMTNELEAFEKSIRGAMDKARRLLAVYVDV